MTPKRPSHRLTLFLGAALLAFTLLLTLPALAQDAVLEFVGELQGQTTTTATVNGVTFDITSAEIRGPLAVGGLVKVQASLINNQYVARLIEARGDDDLRPNEMEIVGFVQAIDSSALLVGGQLINLTGAQVAPGIDAGAVVRAHLTASESGWVARSVRLFNVGGSNDDSSGIIDNFDNNDDVELVGTLQGVGPGHIILSGQQFDVSQAEVRGLLALGSLVRVQFAPVGGDWVVREVRSVGLPGLRGSNDDSSGSLFLGNNDNSRGFILGNNDNGSFSSSVFLGNNDNSLRGNNDDSSGTRNNLVCGVVPNGWTTYVIVRGDTLSGIASRSGASLRDIVNVNCIRNPNNVPIGTILLVPRTPATRQLFIGNDDGSFSSSGSLFLGNNDNSLRGNNDDSSGSRNRNRGGGDDNSNSWSSSGSNS